MKHVTQLSEGRECIRLGEIIAYPTEAVYGLGCDPFNHRAVKKLLALKERRVEQGLILLVATWDQVFSLTAPVPEKALFSVKKSWPGPVTWIFPKAHDVPDWISGAHAGVAIRMTAHPVAQALCKEIPLVSTSANISGQTPATDFLTLQTQFPQGVDVFFEGELGGASQPSEIYDVMSGLRLR